MSRDQRAAIVCAHVALKGMPILYAVRDQPLEDADSGWQFLCKSSDEEEDAAQVWAVFEVVEMDPTIEAILNSPPLTNYFRKSIHDPWEEGLS